MAARRALLTLASPVGDAPGVGPAREKALRAAGCETVADLLSLLPVRYEDRSRPTPIASVSEPGAVTLVGRLRRARSIRLRGRRTMVRAELWQGEASLPVVWFNRPYWARQIDEEASYLLHGEVRRGRSGLELLNPSCERAARAATQDRWTPVYPSLGGGLGPATLRDLTRRAFEALGPPEEWLDPLPEELARRWRLAPLGPSLAALHAPPERWEESDLGGRDTPQHRRLIYGELLALQLRLALQRRQARRPKPQSYRHFTAAERLRGQLPFDLTGAQRRVVEEIHADLAAPSPMRRLLQGDVGSGKTVVAALAAVAALENGHQVAVMAPTAVLAEQLFRVLSSWLSGEGTGALLTGGSEEATEVRRRLAAGDLDWVVGTHSLIQDSVEFARLGLVVIDEQQRFGVGQRELLGGKGARPDLLVMTATPIPRTLALTAYGDLDLSVLDELPAGRVPPRTEMVPAEERPAAYRRLREAVREGAQAYVVFPRIDEGAGSGSVAAEREGRQLADWLGDVTCAVVHGRLGSEERQRALADFAEGRVRVLIATTVIEVGVDVPAANWMVIEGAERFGLSQLHQLRGRIGRGGGQATCLVIHGEAGEEALRRLSLFSSTTDGFQLAEADLEARGPGELAGLRQAGQGGLRLADLARDRGWVERAREDAASLLKRWSEEQVLSFLAYQAVEAPELASEAGTGPVAPAGES